LPFRFLRLDHRCRGHLDDFLDFRYALQRVNRFSRAKELRAAPIGAL
jgi:hypothetical protein